MLRKDKWELHLLIFLTALLIIPVWFFNYFPTTDGPSHVESALMIRSLIFGDCPQISNLFHFTNGIVPNWIGHFFIAVLSSFMSPMAAEKIVISSYLILFATAVYQLIKTLNKTALFMVFPIMIFTYNSLLLSGSYNFVIGITLYMLFLKFWLLKRDQFSLRNTAILSLMMLILYLSHLFALAAFALSIALIATYDLAFRKSPAIFFKQGLAAVIAILPSLYAFSTYINLPKNLISGEISISEKMIYLFFPTINVFAGADVQINYIFTALFWIMVSMLTYHRIRSRQALTFNDWPLFFALLIAFVIIVIPATFGGGWMIEIRLEMLYYIFLLLWVATHNFNPTIKKLIVSISLLIFMANFANKLYYFEKYNRIMNIYTVAEKYIPDHSTIFTVDISPQIIDYDKAEANNHIPIPIINGYMLANKCIAEVSNFHSAEKNVFPISYIDSKNPYGQLGRFRTEYALPIIPPQVDIAKYEKTTGIKIDYIIIRGKKELMMDYKDEANLNSEVLYDNLYKQISSGFDLIYTSPKNLVKIYKRK